MTPEELLSKYGPRESMEYDGRGGRRPGGAGHRDPPQAAGRAGRARRPVCVLRRGPSRARTSSGAIMDPRARPSRSRTGNAARRSSNRSRDEFLFLTRAGEGDARFFLPDCFRNHGNYRLARRGRLVQQAEALGWRSSRASPRPRCCTTTPARCGGVTGNMGQNMGAHAGVPWVRNRWRSTRSSPRRARPPGPPADREVPPDEGRDPQSYGIGIKELWQADPARHQPPGGAHRRLAAGRNTYGGRSCTTPRTEDRGRLRGRADYANPYLSPFEEFQRWKTHPRSAALEVASASATARDHRRRTLSLPQLVFPGGDGRLRGGLPNASRIMAARRATGMRRPRSRRSVRAGRATSWSSTRRWRSNRAGCTPSCASRRTSSSGSRRTRPGHADDRYRAVAAAQARHPQSAVDAAPDRPDHACLSRPRATSASRTGSRTVLTFDRLSSVFCRARSTTRTSPATSR